MIKHLKLGAAGFGFAALAVTSLSGVAHAQFPQKTIEFIIPFGAGGGADIEGRLLATEMGKILGVNLVPINKVGGGGAIAYTYIKNAKPDGYTVGWNSTSILTTTNIGNVDFKYNALDQVGRVEWQPMPFAVRGDARWKSFEEFVKECKAKPETLKVSNSGTGSATHLAAIALMDAAGCKAIHLPVGIKRRNASVLSGEADAMIAPLTGAVNLTKAGKLKLLVMPTEKRNPVMPDVPTAKELGYNAILDLFRGLSVPKGTPDSVKTILADAMAKAANSKSFMALAAKKGFTVDPMGVADFEKLLQAEDAKVKGIMESAGLYRSK
ncbi:MAG: tripartite tricarboxylate transporter substrate binding protein [Hyphomicrobiales bacterium]